MKLKYCLTGILCLFLKTDAQIIKPLTVGDKVPALAIKNIYNYPALQSNLSAFKDKLVILDFMATTCISCVKGLPALDSLQKKFSGKIQVILVTNEPALKVKAFLARNSKIKFPFVYGDSVLSKLFPYTFIPHEVWINKGIVKAITYPEYVNEKNINALLAGENIDLPVKLDMAKFDYTQPLVHINEHSVPALSIPSHMYYSWLGSHIDNIPPMEKLQPDSQNQTIKISFINKPLIDLYLRSYGLFHLPASRIILEGKDTDLYLFNKRKSYREEWKKQNTWCYEAVLPVSTPVSERQQRLRSDLDIFSPVRGRMEQRNVECLVLQQTDSVVMLKPVFSSRSVPNMVSLSYIIYMLDNTFSGIPVIDETGLKKAWIQGDDTIIGNMPLLVQVLKKYGLQLLTRYRQVDMLVLSEKINNQLK